MSTLAEIEAAVRTLPRTEKETLLRHLSQQLSAPAGAASLERRRAWLTRLAKLRARTKTVGASVQEIFDDIRSER
jgi:hypothetical protein